MRAASIFTYSAWKKKNLRPAGQTGHTRQTPSEALTQRTIHQHNTACPHGKTPQRQTNPAYSCSLRHSHAQRACLESTSQKPSSYQNRPPLPSTSRRPGIAHRCLPRRGPFSRSAAAACTSMPMMRSTIAASEITAPILHDLHRPRPRRIRCEK